MSDERPLDDGLAALSQFFVGDKTMHETLGRVAEMAAQALPVVAYTGMTLMDKGKVATTVFTDPTVPEIDQAQYESNEGPCLHAFRQGVVIRIDSTRHDTRFPAFSRMCVEHGVLSTLSCPLTIEGATNGALNLYATVEDAFGATETQTASLFASQAAIVLANATAYSGARARAEQLEHALSTRAVIEQAKGILMSTMRCSADEAFQLLVAQSQKQNRKLRDIAVEITEQASRRG